MGTTFCDVTHCDSRRFKLMWDNIRSDRTYSPFIRIPLRPICFEHNQYHGLISYNYRGNNTLVTNENSQLLLLLLLLLFRHYSPRWTLSSSEIILYSSPSWYFCLQVLTPTFFRSPSSDSRHLNLGFPTRRVPWSLRTVSFLQGPTSCILKRCPSHLSLHIFVTLTMSNSSYRV